MLGALIFGSTNIAWALVIPVQTCPPGQTLIATAADRDLATKAGIPTSSQCWNPSDPTTGRLPAEAKAFLINRYANPGPCSQKGLSDPRTEGIEKLDAQFAINLAAMLKAAPMYIGINSAFRTQQAQQCANPRVKSSNHSRGCAVDLGYSQKSCDSVACRWVLANASKYHIVLRMRYSPEWNHIEPQTCNGTSVGSVMTSGGYMEETEGVDVPPESSAPYYCLVSVAPIVTIPSQTPPGPGCYNQSQMQTPYPSPLMQSAPMTNPSVNPSTGGAAQPQICTPSFTCANNVMYYRTSTCQTQTYQVCAYGCNGNTCAGASTTSAVSSRLDSSFSSSSTSTTVADSNTDSGAATGSISDFLNSFANPVAVDIGTSTGLAFTLNPETGEIEHLSPAARALVPTGTSSGIMSAVQPIGATQTFTSSDLANTGVRASAQTSGLQSILAGLRDALTWAISYLTPFRGAAANPLAPRY